MKKYLLHLLFLSSLLSSWPVLSLTESKRVIEEATRPETQWGGPVSGPRTTPGKRLVFVASDMRNGGVKGVAEGVAEAVKKIDWHVQYIDARGSSSGQTSALIKAIGLKPDGIILGGIDASSHKAQLKLAKKRGINIVGWHVADTAKMPADSTVFTNITTDGTKVAEAAAHFAIDDSMGQARVVIFTDNNFSIARLKAQKMAELIEACGGCKLLETRNIPLGDTELRMSSEMAGLMDKYDYNITHFLAINDLYFDFALPSPDANALRPKNISAGDGSREAYRRIRANGFQVATVPEPLYMQGWQIIDEINRSFNHYPSSDYVAKVKLITRENIQTIGNNNIYDPENQYRKKYLDIWLGR